MTALAATRGTQLVEYTFEIKGKVEITLEGADSENNYNKAVKEALRQLYLNQLFDEDNVIDCETKEYTDYEEEE